MRYYFTNTWYYSKQTMTNPVKEIGQKQEPLILMHNEALSLEDIDKAINLGKSIEIDLHMNADGEVKIGHPPEHYLENDKVMPSFPDISEVMDKIVDADVFVTFDLKQQQVLPAVKEMIDKLGSERTLVHSFVEIDEKTAENEFNSTAALLEFKQETGTAIVTTTRELSPSELTQAKLTSIINTVDDVADVLGLYIENYAPPSIDIIKQIYDSGLVLAIPIPGPVVPEFGVGFLGATNSLSLATQIYKNE